MTTIVASLLTFSLAAMDPTPLSIAGKIEAAMYGDHRSEANIARNRYRHPVGTLTFFGLEEDDRVLELWPGGGWYMEILAPVLNGTGSYTAAAYDPTVPDQPQYRYSQVERMQAAWKERPDLYGTAVFQPYSPPQSASLGEAESYDLVLTFRSMHGLVNAGMAQDVINEMYRVLAPGGTLGVVQHRADVGTDPASTARRGYVSEDAIIAMAEEAGFELVARSEVNANPKDTHDHPEGVWTLPPSLRLGDQDRERYLAIGESDRMTLRFVKPGK